MTLIVTILWKKINKKYERWEIGVHIPWKISRRHNKNLCGWSLPSSSGSAEQCAPPKACRIHQINSQDLFMYVRVEGDLGSQATSSKFSEDELGLCGLAMAECAICCEIWKIDLEITWVEIINLKLSLGSI